MSVMRLTEALHACHHARGQQRARFSGLLLVQWAKTGRFQLFNHGSAATNTHVYKKPEPPDIAEGYHLLDIPVDLVAGERSHSQLVFWKNVTGKWVPLQP